MGIDPDYAGPPQIQAGTYLYPRVTTDWVLRLDCDELVLCENGRLSERLAALPADIQTAIIRPCEQLISDLPAHHHLFRMRMTDEDAQQIYGDMAELLSKRRGLMSHAFGKSAHRTGIQNIEVREHNAVFIGTNTRTNNLAWMRKKGVSLLHFNAEVFEKWKAAAARRSRNASFAPALSAKILAAEASETADTELRQIYDTIVHFDTRRTDALLETDCGFVLDFDFDVLIDRYFDSAQLMLRAG
ncbi:hypothetical protein [Ketogulonicigenium vulgare]|nr:hypothetical protein [Ketogulonicigenium vulgare]